MIAVQPLQSITYQVEDECFPANRCSKIARYVSAWFHGQQHLARKLCVFTLLKDLHADRANPNQFARLLCISEKLEESPLLGDWCGEKGRTAAMGVGMQPQDWEDNIPSMILRYETKAASCWSTLEPLGTQQTVGCKKLPGASTCAGEFGFWGVLFHAVIQCLDVPVVLDS